MRKILVTGGAGFIGSYLVNRLSRENYIFVLDNFSSGTGLLLKKNENVKIVNSNLNKNILNYLIGKSDVVVHLASLVGVDVTIKNFKGVIQNLKNTVIITDLCKKYNKPIVYASSSDVYGLLGLIKRKKFKEDDLLVFQNSQRWNYAKVKSLEENYIKIKNIPYIIFRIFNTYGFGVDLKRPSRVFSSFLYSIIFHKPLIIYGDGNQKRAFCYIDDLVNGFILGINFVLKNHCRETFNIGNDKEIYSINQLKNIMISEAKKLKIIKQNLPVLYLPLEERGAKFIDIEFRQPDLSKIKKVLGYTPKISLREGVRLSLKNALKYKNKWKRILNS